MDGSSLLIPLLLLDSRMDIDTISIEKLGGFSINGK
jgi:hypothetical protein